MNTRDLLAPLIVERGGALLESTDAEVVFLDHFLRGVLPLPSHLESPEQQERVLSLVDRLYDRAKAHADLKPTFRVHATVEDLCEAAIVRDGLPRLLDLLCSAASCELVLQFSRQPAQWIPSLRWLHKTLTDTQSLSGHVTLRGPFDLLDDTAKEGLYGMEVRVEFAIGWWQGCERREASAIRAEALRDLARFGLRVPLVCYVHADNIGLCSALLEEGLLCNEHSGFALPLVFCHPHYSFGGEDPALPDPDTYISLLSQCFREYPYYDDVFFPVNELASLVGRGGWIPNWDVPAAVNLLVSPTAGVGMFRLVPAFARSWIGWDSLAKVEGGSLAASLLDHHRQTFRWESNPFCRACPWRYVCGGADGWDGLSDSVPTALRLACEHRKQYLREKVKLLLPDALRRWPRDGRLSRVGQAGTKAWLSELPRNDWSLPSLRSPFFCSACAGRPTVGGRRPSVPGLPPCSRPRLESASKRTCASVWRPCTSSSSTRTDSPRTKFTALPERLDYP